MCVCGGGGGGGNKQKQRLSAPKELPHVGWIQSDGIQMNHPGRQKSKRCNSWQQAKHEKLYSDLPQALK